MEQLLGEQILKKQNVTADQLEEALERQRRHGGRIGENLVALGYVSDDDLASFFEQRPPAPETVEETGLELRFISNLILKQVSFMGDFVMKDVCRKSMLPLRVVDDAVQLLQEDKMVEVKGAEHYMRSTFTFSITEQGRDLAKRLLEQNRYLGPAPVTLEDYRRLVVLQTIKNIVVSEESVKEAFSRLVVSPKMLHRLGPAISSGRAMFLYGPPGNGKTTIAETIGKILPGIIYMPYAVLVEGEIIRVYDPVTHRRAESPDGDEPADRRWIRVHRPVIVTGGELTLRMLDLEYNDGAKFYEAPLQMKANNGLFIVDDFGRQRVEADALLNRWIVPLERRTDFLSLHTGMDFEIPFDELIIFSTNIEPAKLVDEAFLRRIRYKIKVDHPTVHEYAEIFRRICVSHDIEFKPDVFAYLLNEFYKKRNIPLNACHPRDLVDYVIDHAHYYRSREELTKETITEAWDSYFVDM